MDLDPGSPPKEFCWDPSTNPDTYIYDTYMIKAYNWCAYKEEQSELILIIFHEVDIQPISIRAAPHTSHVKDEH